MSRMSAALDRILGVALPRAVQQKTDALAQELLAEIQANTPVITGATRDAWRVTTEGAGLSRKVTVGNPLPHVVELEHGTSFRAPTGIVAPAIETVRRRRGRR